MPFIQIIAKIIKILRSEGTPLQIAMGFALGMMAGLIPISTLHAFMLWVIVIIFNVSFGAFLFAYILFSGIAYVMDPIFHQIGYYFLVKVDWLHGFWVFLSKLPVIPYTRFNNTVVLGSTIIALLIFVPVYFLIKYFILFYRLQIDARIQKWKIIHILKSSKLVQFYNKLKNLGDA